MASYNQLDVQGFQPGYTNQQTAYGFQPGQSNIGMQSYNQGQPPQGIPPYYGGQQPQGMQYQGMQQPSFGMQQPAYSNQAPGQPSVGGYAVGPPQPQQFSMQSGFVPQEQTRQQQSVVINIQQPRGVPPPVANPYTSQRQNIPILPNVVNTRTLYPSNANGFRTSTLITCPNCRASSRTKISYAIGATTIGVGILIGVCIFPIFGFIPCLMNDCKDVEHHCSNCGAHAGVGKYEIF